MALRILELFAGVGGCAAAAPDGTELVAAVDQSRLAQTVHQLNASHRFVCRNLESIPSFELAAFRAHLWWCSPPCQPFTIKGRQRDLDDPRCTGLLALTRHVQAVHPPLLVLENVEGFAGTHAHALFLQALKDYPHVQMLRLCPTQWGIPNRRPRLYITASHSPWNPLTIPDRPPLQPLHTFLDPPHQRLNLPTEWITRYGRFLPAVDPRDPRAVTRCFTASYGRSPFRSGSYVRRQTGDLRFFSPREMARLLGFPDTFRFPASTEPRILWRLLGNSLSIPVIRAILDAAPLKGPKGSAGPHYMA